MDPNQQYPIDYLNQIAPPEPKSPINPRLLYVAAGLIGALVLVGILVFALSATRGRPVNNLVTLAAELKMIEGVAKSQHATINSRSLRSINGTLKVILADANREIAPLIPTDKPKQASIAPDDNGLKNRLNDARLNAVFDRTYAREMTYQLERIAGLAKSVSQTTESQATKDVLNRMGRSLTPLRSQLASFTAAGS